jgi:cell fate regulator YaaT (PSP1 superfamily)
MEEPRPEPAPEPEPDVDPEVEPAPEVDPDADSGPAPGCRAEVCYGALRHREWFGCGVEGLRTGDRCVVRTQRGVEIGRLVTEVLPWEGEEGDGETADGGEILRAVGPDDETREEDLIGRRRNEALEYGRERIAARDLPMRLVDVEHLLGGNRVVFYFTAPRRVDFRDLVRDLSRRFRTRIELRQIGARDEAKVLGDDEMCGRELCCRSHMRELKPVTMKMAKNQKTTLDPSRISGRCGRLMCCLRYEDEAYSDLRAKLPRCGLVVETESGPGKVVSQDILRQEVQVRLEGGRRISCNPAELGPASEPKSP